VRRWIRWQRPITGLFVVLMTLGTVLIAQRMLSFFGPRGWFNKTLLLLGIVGEPVRLVHNATGVEISLMIADFPVVFLLLLGFVSGIDRNLERAARMLGASPLRVVTRVLLPLAVPGILAAGLLALVRTIAVFELTFLTAGASSQTLADSLYYATFSAGIRPTQSIDAIAVIYMLTTAFLLVLALRFINPFQVVSRVKQ
jgi:ABC-type spermidine/putrescine transport system permease subunit II